MMNKKINTFDEYMADESRVSEEDKLLIELEASLISKMIEERESKGFTQRELADKSGVKQPAIARIESLKTIPRIDTLIKVLRPLGYTIDIVSLSEYEMKHSR